MEVNRACAEVLGGWIGATQHLCSRACCLGCTEDKCSPAAVRGPLALPCLVLLSPALEVLGVLLSKETATL